MFYFFIPFLVRRHHLISNLGEETPVYRLFERGGIPLLGKFGRRLVVFLYIYLQNYVGGWLEFHFMVHALPGGPVI